MAEIIVVGGGVAGLSAGIYARLGGHKVTILEKNKHPGGNLTGWRRSDCVIDNCIHWLTGTNPSSKTFELWQTLGAITEKTEILQPRALFTVEEGGQSVTLWRNLAKLTYELTERFPDERKQAMQFIHAVKAIEYLGGVGGADHDSRNPMKILRYFPSLLHFYGRTAGEIAAEVSSPVFKAFFTALTGENYASLGLVCATAAFCSGNGGLPRGGSYAMAMRIVRRFQSLGGLLKTGTEVASVIGGKKPLVKLTDGEVLSADYVIVATEPRQALGAAFPKGHQERDSNEAYQNFSAMQVAFEVDIKALPFRGIYLIPSQVAETGYLSLREFAHEPDFAPNGKTVLQAMLLCGASKSRYWIDLYSDKERYRSEKANLALQIAQMIHQHFPTLRGKLRCLDVWTPASYKQWTGAPQGCFMAYTMPSGKRPKALSPKSPDMHILWATQWLQTPGGLPYAAMAGKKAVECIPSD